MHIYMNTLSLKKKFCLKCIFTRLGIKIHSFSKPMAAKIGCCDIFFIYIRTIVCLINLNQNINSACFSINTCTTNVIGLFMYAQVYITFVLFIISLLYPCKKVYIFSSTVNIDSFIWIKKYSPYVWLIILASRW